MNTNELENRTKGQMKMKPQREYRNLAKTVPSDIILYLNFIRINDD